MTDAAGDRPQDVGRKHSRRGAPSPATVTLLDEYYAAIRLELRAILIELGMPTVPTGQLPAFDLRPTLDRRRPLWDLAVKLARELAAESGAGEIQPVGGPSGRARPAPRLTVAARRHLGG